MRGGAIWASEWIECSSPSAAAWRPPRCSSTSAARSSCLSAATPSLTTLQERSCAHRTRSNPVTIFPCAWPAVSSTPRSGARVESRNSTSGLFIVAGAAGDLQHSQESFLRNVHAADALHALLAFLLLFKELALARDLSAVALGDHVLAYRADCFACNHAAADGGLDGHLEHLAGNQFSQAADQVVAPLVGLFAMTDDRQRIDGLAANQHVELHQIGFAITGKVVIKRSVAARHAFQPVVEIEDDFVQRHLVGQHDARWRKVFELFLYAALFLAQGQNSAD